MPHELNALNRDDVNERMWRDLYRDLYCDVVEAIKLNDVLYERAKKRCTSGMLPNPPCDDCLVWALREWSE